MTEYGVNARDAGLAMRANMSACRHEVTEPVVLSTGELVAAVCTTCLAELPKSWGCPDCEWDEVRRLCDPVPQVVLAAPCPRHA